MTSTFTGEEGGMDQSIQRLGTSTALKAGKFLEIPKNYSHYYLQKRAPFKK
jgi:hypothetical protein